MIKRKKKLDPATLEKCLECACLSFRQASRLVTQLFDDALVPVGLVSAQLPVLIVIAVHGPVTITRLASLLIMDRTTLNRTLKPLLAKGYYRTVSTADKRKSMLEITEKGHEIMVASYPLWQKAQGQIVRGLKEERWEVMRKELGEVVQIASRR